jgi:type VI secretion system secreted protein VgrG
VVGPSGEEIYTDKHGRVKVQFHWDRYGKKDQDSSCWVRVASVWAGAKWGGIQIPRIGQEVIVEFLEGDPDRPIITGRVYNNDQMPPWELPANMTQSGILSRSSKNGSGENANAIRMEDMKGSEQLWIHAEKNQDIEVENDETHWVGHDRRKTIDHDETIHVKHDRTETVGNNETISIGANRTEDVGENASLNIVKDCTIDIGQNESRTVGKDETIEVGQNRKETIAKNVTTDVGETREARVGKDDRIQVGKKFYLEAGDEITLKTGGASITLKKDGKIQIKGKDITVVGDGKIGIKASGQLTLKGSKIAEN